MFGSIFFITDIKNKQLTSGPLTIYLHIQISLWCFVKNMTYTSSHFN